MKCQKHKLKKDFVFCLELGCKDRLVCQQCFNVDQQHNNHHHLCIDQFMNNDEDQMSKIFDQLYLYSFRNHQNLGQFTKLLDDKFNKYMDEREEMIRIPFEKMIIDYRFRLQQIKARICQQYKLEQVPSVVQIQYNIQQLINNGNDQQNQKQIKQMIDSANQIGEMQKKLDLVFKRVERDDQQMADNFQQVIDNYESKINGYLITNDLKTANQLMELTEININDADKIDQYRNQIQQCQQQNKQFKIYIQFYFITNPNQRQQVIEIIDQCRSNDRVVKLDIMINDDNKNDIESLVHVLHKYTNICCIYIHDYLNQVNNDVHDQLKALIKERTILQFYLGFWEGLSISKHSLNLIKQYNQLIVKDRGHLERLHYCNRKINKNFYQNEQIQQLINEVLNI